jgi:hypothetical protein
MYIDPGAGSLVLQVLAAGLLAMGIAFKRGREMVTGFLASIFRRVRRR